MMTGMYAVFSFLIGASLTSFFGVLGSRLPQGESINGRSVCDHCQSVLSAHALIPILGYLLMRGRCGRCRQRVSSKYPLFELLGGGLFVVGYLAQPFFDVRLLAYFVFVSVMLVGVFSAMAFYELPWQVWGLGLVTLAAIQVVAPTLARWDSTVALVLVTIMVGLYHRFQSRLLDKGEGWVAFVQATALSLLLLGLTWGMAVVVGMGIVLILIHHLPLKSAGTKRQITIVGVALTSLVIYGLLIFSNHP